MLIDNSRAAARPIPEWRSALDASGKEARALDWLRAECVAPPMLALSAEQQAHLRTLKAMLAEPRIPAPNDHPAIDAIASKAGLHRGYVDLVLNAMREAPKPTTKVVQVWRVEYAAPAGDGSYTPQALTYPTERCAREQAQRVEGGIGRCIRVTGPHSQEVPVTD